MSLLSSFALLPIDWNLSPEHAVTMYLEWGNNDWHSEYPPVRSKDDFSIYFVVDTWGDAPLIRLIRRNSENAEDLAVIRMPEALLPAWKEDYEERRGIFEPTPAIKEWLKKELGQ